MLLTHTHTYCGVGGPLPCSVKCRGPQITARLINLLGKSAKLSRGFPKSPRINVAADYELFFLDIGSAQMRHPIFVWKPLKTSLFEQELWQKQKFSSTNQQHFDNEINVMANCALGGVSMKGGKANANSVMINWHTIKTLWGNKRFAPHSPQRATKWTQ